MAEMTFLESFRFIDTYTEAVLKLREASHAIQRNGADLKEWEAKGKLIKDKIQKEIDALNKERTQTLKKRNDEEECLLTRGREAEASIKPILAEAKETQEALDVVAKQLKYALEDKAKVIESAKSEVKKILFEAKSEANQIKTEIEKKRLHSEDRLLAVETKIKTLKDGLNNL
ncbi:hypothetical protein LCGC14_1899470 [marine sediment metagenome]|uniref:Uncharacterized protein n=1 Tax=marine sediment metagenome TaxID=412755 RepID=A0A0F9IAY1_9ZZZZ